MPGQKRSRYLRRMARRTRASDQPKREPSDRQVALRAAAAARDKQLSELAAKFLPKITELDEKWTEERRKVWRDYEERKDLIHQAHILTPAKA